MIGTTNANPVNRTSRKAMEFRLTPCREKGSNPSRVPMIDVTRADSPGISS